MDEKVKTYFDKQALEQKKVLEKIRRLVARIAPQAEECLSYGVPAFRQDGKLLLYAAFKNHVGLYPEPETIAHFAAELGRYGTSKGAIRFPLAEAIPYGLMERIVRYRFGIAKK